MQNMYFNYILSQCKRKGIAHLSSVFLTKEKLQDAANKEFNGHWNITNDWRLIEAARAYLHNCKPDNTRLLSRDTQIIYDRCLNGLHQIQSFINARVSADHDRMFDVMVDYCLLIASIQNSQERNLGQIILLVNPIQICISLRKHLRFVYDSAKQDFTEYSCIVEAMEARERFFTGCYPFKYEGSRKYLSYDIPKSELNGLQEGYRNSSIMKMALFYGLTATSVLAEEIRRQLL